MKGLINFLYVIFTFIILSSFIKANEDCYITGGACIETITTDEVEVYPGCFIYVQYKVITCPYVPVQVDFLGYFFNFTTNNPCLPLYTNLFPLYPNRNITDDNVWESIETILKETVLNKIINNIANSSTNGKDDFLCGQNNQIILQMSNVVCEALCMRDAEFITDPITGMPIVPANMNLVNIDPQEPIIIVQKVPCQEVCCVIERSYCYNKVLVNGQYEYILQYNETKNATQSYMFCEATYPEACTLPDYVNEYTYPGLSQPWYYIGECYDTCEEE